MKTTMFGLCTLLFFSCNKEDFPGQVEGGTPCDYICFGISPDGVAQTKGGIHADAGEYTSGRFVLRSTDSADTLCMRAVVSDGIGGAERAVTRGTPVSNLEAYDEFHVVCDRSDMPDKFFMDVDVTPKSGGLWGTDVAYYWPGAGPTLQFYAWAPTDADVFTSTPTKDNLTFAYTVPAAAAGQKDLLVTKSDALAGDYNQQVDLTFSHICTAVKFVVGGEMQPGTIKSVALKGVYNTGTYSLADDGWTLDNSTTADFTQTLDKPTTGDETDGTEITTGEGTFMMLPQTLPDGAMVEVSFQDGTTGTARTLSASIGGTEWPQGKTVTYKLSITPEYDLEFISEPRVQDAHYVIYPITIKAQDVPDGEWTLTSNDPTHVTFVEGTLPTFARRGFWVEEEKGTQSLTSNTAAESITVNVYLEENAGDKERNLELYLSPANNTNAKRTFTFSQLCPSWNGNLGCERIEEYDEGYTGYPWGFKWEEGLQIKYDFGNLLFGGHTFESIILGIYLALFNSNPWVSGDTEGILDVHYVVTFNFDKISHLDVATSKSDGHLNTSQLYNFNGLNDASSMMQMIEEWGIEPDQPLASNPTEFAARAAIMKNKFNKITTTEQGQQVERVELKEENLFWYLPAQNEAPQMRATDDYPLYTDKAYWTSTAAGGEDNEQAFKYDVASGSTALEKRDTELRVRAVRKKEP